MTAYRSVTTLVALVCVSSWLSRALQLADRPPVPQWVRLTSLVFLGLHLTITKRTSALSPLPAPSAQPSLVYANAFMATSVALCICSLGWADVLRRAQAERPEVPAHAQCS